jgi:uncharacterized protein YkwD
MTRANDAPNSWRLHIHPRFFAALLAALLLTACSGSPSTTPPNLAPHWPPDNPAHPERLASPLPAGADPLVWWKATFFDTLPSEVYPDSYAAKVAASLIKETNKTRANNGGLPPVVEDPLLDRVAQAHAIDEATRDYWNHKNPEGMGSHARVLAASGITVTAGAENSSVSDTLNDVTAGTVVVSFLHHVGHRELLLNKDVRRIGVGIYRYAPDEQVHIIQLLMDY